MKYTTLFHKLLYRTYLLSSLPIVTDRLKLRRMSGLPSFRPLNLNILRQHLTAHVTDEELSQLHDDTQQIMNGWLHIFHEPPVKCTSGVFQRHPRTGRACELPHWSRVSISSLAKDEDVKFIWEINRLGDLDKLIACAIVDKQIKYLYRALELVIQWRRENPFNYGINWCSNMEAALRLLRLLLLRGLLTSYNCEISDIDAAVVEHHQHVATQWHFTKNTMMGGNHLIVELAALSAFEFMTGETGPVYQKLINEAERQFLPDGGYFEGSTGYHVYVLSVLLFTRFLAHAAGLELKELTQVLNRAVKFIEIIKGPDETIPAIGDGDDGALFRPLCNNPRNVRDIINFYSHEGSHIKKIILHDKDKWTHLCSSGMAVHRRKDGKVLCFRSSPIHYGHSHLDMLSLHLMSDEGPIILDGGTGAYNYSFQMRHYYRSPEAHSTLFSKDVMPLKPLRHFAWKGALMAHLSCNGPDASGEYDIKNRGTLRRTVTIKDNGYEITDTCPDKISFWCQYIVPKAELSQSGIIIKNIHSRPVLLLSIDSKQKNPPLIKPHSISYYYGEERQTAAICFPVYRKIITRLLFLD